MTRLSIADGQNSAERRAIADTQLYQKATARFGTIIEPYRGDAPLTLGLCHVLRVNPQLFVSPEPSKDRRRGFMFATIGMAREAGVKWEELDKPTTCAYIWGRDINADGKNLYSNNQTVFSEPDADFWKCAYMKHTLGDAAFKAVWAARDNTQPTVYASLLYAVNDLKRSLPGWPVMILRKTVLVDLPYVFEMTKRGGKLYSDGYGVEPVLTKNAFQQVFV